VAEQDRNRNSLSGLPEHGYPKRSVLKRGATKASQWLLKPSDNRLWQKYRARLDSQLYSDQLAFPRTGMDTTTILNSLNTTVKFLAGC
jgi:hypothetical protein